MKKRNIILALAGLAIIAAGCALRDHQTTNDPKAKYVLIFGSASSPVKLKSQEARVAFIAALDNANWRRDIAFKNPEPTDPSANAGPKLSSAANTVHTLTITQDSTVNPDGLHVTQRVGLNAAQEDVMNTLLAQVQE